MPVRAAPNQNHLTTLAYRIHGLDGPFSCGGSALPAKPITITFARGVTLTVTRDPDRGRSVLGEAFVKQCTPAGFGFGRATRRDKRIRDGKHLLAKDNAFKIRGLERVLPAILKRVQRALAPADADPPIAELYALNVYEPGGKFVVHKDTPRSADSLGTLVVCLPIRFSGGDLVLQHGAVEEFAWSRAIDEQREARRLHWAAFFGDVDHEIEPIYAGTRVTLTWNLRHASTELARAQRSRPSANERDLAIALESALADPTFMPKGGVLGMPCSHLYAEVSGLAKPAATVSARLAKQLKGRDRELANAAIMAGLEARFRPYIFESDVEERWRLTRLPSDREVAIFRGRQISAFTIEETLPIEHHVGYSHQGQERDEDVTWISPPPWKRRDPGVAAELLGALEYSATGYFGNEGSDAAFYVSAALLIDVPPARSRPKRKPG